MAPGILSSSAVLRFLDQQLGGNVAGLVIKAGEPLEKLLSDHGYDAEAIVADRSIWEGLAEELRRATQNRLSVPAFQELVRTACSAATSPHGADPEVGQILADRSRLFSVGNASPRRVKDVVTAQDLGRRCLYYGIAVYPDDVEKICQTLTDQGYAFLLLRYLEDERSGDASSEAESPNPWFIASQTLIPHEAVKAHTSRTGWWAYDPPDKKLVIERISSP